MGKFWFISDLLKLVNCKFNFLKMHKYKFTYRNSFCIITAKNESHAVQKFLYEHPWNDGNFKIEKVD